MAHDHKPIGQQMAEARRGRKAREASPKRRFRRCPSCNGSGLAINTFSGEPDICRTCMGDTRIACKPIKENA